MGNGRAAAGLAIISLAAIAAGCGGSDTVRGCMDPTAVNYDPKATQDDGSCLAFQGPRNPDFEATGASGEWVYGINNGYAGNGFAGIETGTGFMPTHGIRFLSMSTGTSNNFYYGTLTVYQDGVNLQRSSSLTLDYAASGIAASGCDVTVEILFTASGTTTLWSKTFTSSFDVQKLNETVALPALPDPGRLTIRLTASGGQNTSASIQLDDLRVN